MHFDRIAAKAVGLARHALMGLGAFALVAAPAAAQEMETFDPDSAYPAQTQPDASTGAIDGDLIEGESTAAPGAPETAPPLDQNQPYAVDGTVVEEQPEADVFEEQFEDYASDAEVADANEATETVATAEPNSNTYGEDDLIGAAEGVFGKGAEGLAKMIQGLLKDQGEPNGYIVGREAGGAFIIGARYGSGTLYHKVEGEQKVYWTGPSIGLDAGANAANTFVLVYNLYDTEDLFERFPAGEGQAYLIGGLHASYMRRGDVVLIPVRVGAGVRLGINAGYMKFSKKQRWLPF